MKHNNNKKEEKNTIFFCEYLKTAIYNKKIGKKKKNQCLYLLNSS